MSRRGTIANGLTVLLGAGIAGLGQYILLSVIARAVPAHEYGEFSTYWSIAVVLALGVFFPIEQETARRIAAVPPAPGRPRLLRAIAVAAGLALVAMLVIIAALSGWSSSSGFLDLPLLLGVAATTIAYAVQFPVRGIVSGRHQPLAYAAIVGTEGALRIVLPIALALLGAPVAWFAAAVAISSLLAVVPGIGQLRAVGHSELPRARVRDVAAASAGLVAAALAAQALLNGPVLLTRLAEPDAAAAAGRVLSLLALARIPIVLYQAGQVMYLPRLSRAVAEGRWHEVTRTILMAVAIVLAASVVVDAVLLALGDFVLSLLFGPALVLGGPERWLLVAGTTLFLLALVLSDACVALARHRAITTVWGAALGLSIVVFLVPMEPWLRASLPLAVGGATAITAFPIVILRALSRSA